MGNTGPRGSTLKACIGRRQACRPVARLSIGIDGSGAGRALVQRVRRLSRFKMGLWVSSQEAWPLGFSPAVHCTYLRELHHSNRDIGSKWSCG